MPIPRPWLAGLWLLSAPACARQAPLPVDLPEGGSGILAVPRLGRDPIEGGPLGLALYGPTADPTRVGSIAFLRTGKVWEQVP